jgi:DNA-binding protein HU-beta
MNKSELVIAIAASAGLTKTASKRTLDVTIEVISKTLKNGEPIVLVGFGTFKVNQRGTRNGRNPRTGIEIKIAARKAISFSAGKKLKDAVND